MFHPLWILRNINFCGFIFGLCLLAIPACGSGEKSSVGACSDSPVIGTYQGNVAGNPDVLTVNSDCSFSSTYCVSEGSVEDTGTATSGNVTITVTETSDKVGCLPLGSTRCGFSYTNNTLEFSCTAGTLTYVRK